MSPVVGTDVSFYQNDLETPKRINFVKMRTHAEFTIIRAGQNTWMDRDIKNNWKDAKTAGIPRGSYWFYDSRAEPKRQANLWMEALAGDLGELPLFLDLEESYGGRFGGWHGWMAFLEQLKNLAPGKEIGIYTGYYYFRGQAPNPTSQPSDLAYFLQYPLWIANYRTSSPKVPLPWKPNEWLFWQYTAVGNGALYGAESKGIDLNIFNGSLKDFRTRFKLVPQPLPPVKPHGQVHQYY